MEDQAYCPECDNAIQGPPLWDSPINCPHCNENLEDYEDEDFYLGLE